MMAGTPDPLPSDSPVSPIYHEVPPKIVVALRVIGAATALMIVLAFIFCLVQGAKESSTFYLLACNTVISAIVGVVNGFWYKKGDLPADKYWYMMIVAMVIIFQCITTDIYVFNYKGTPQPRVNITTTIAPTTAV